MRKYIPFIAALASITAPTIAAAAPAASADASPAGAAGIIVAVAGLIGSLGAAIGGIITARRARQEAAQAQAQATQAQTQASAAQTTATTAATSATTAVQVAAAVDTRVAAAAAWADRHANAMRDGVACIIRYPGVASSCIEVLRVRGWRTRVYDVTAEELAAGQLLPGSTIRADIAAADAVVFEGLTVEGVAALATDRAMRDSIRSGASVIISTGGHNYRYDLVPWGVFCVATNVALTTADAVVSSLAARADIAALQGVRPGRLEEARAELLGGK